MTKVYTVKSNARRDARKRGLDQSSVIAVEGGFIIQKPEPALAAATPEPEALVTLQATEAKPRKARRPKEDAKKNALRDKLQAGWASINDLMKSFGWQAHTVRGAISTLAKREGLRIERIRESGITSYRVARDETA